MLVVIFITIEAREFGVSEPFIIREKVTNKTERSVKRRKYLWSSSDSVCFVFERQNSFRSDHRLNSDSICVDTPEFPQQLKICFISLDSKDTLFSISKIEFEMQVY